MGKVTIKDVAREAGVSISTVSNALNGVDVLKPETREHILEVAERMNYIPDWKGKSLKSKTTNTIGLFVPSIKGTYFGVLADSMYEECEKWGYELNIYISYKEMTMMTNILGRRVDGAVILFEGVNEEHVNLLKEEGIPTVFLDREIADEKISSVLFDSYHQGMLAAEYLLKKGFTHIGHIMGPEKNYDGIERLRGFRDTLEGAGIELRAEDIIAGGFDRDVTYRNMKELLEGGYQPPQAIFAANDLSAIGCLEALKEANIRVPEQVKIMGCDDIEMSELYRPSLTTIRTSFEKQGVIAVRLLVEMLNKKKKGSMEKLEGKLVVRESC